MKLCIVGASGFVGKNFLLSCPKEWQVDAYYRESENFPNWLKKHNVKAKPIKANLGTDEAQFIGKKYDVCLYLAGNSNPQVSWDDPMSDLCDNQLSLVNFLRYTKIKRLIYFSSGAVYDGMEGVVNPSMKLSPKLPYAISKLAAFL